jgi:hypothetical protein
LCNSFQAFLLSCLNATSLHCPCTSLTLKPEGILSQELYTWADVSESRSAFLSLSVRTLHLTFALIVLVPTAVHVCHHESSTESYSANCGQQHQLNHPPATLPSHSLNSVTALLTGSYAMHFIIMVFHDFTTFYDSTNFMEPIMATVTTLYIYNIFTTLWIYGQSLNSQSHLPSPRQQFAPLSEKITAESAAALNSSRKCPRVPAVLTTEPPSLICGVGPPTRTHLFSKHRGVVGPIHG